MRFVLFSFKKLWLFQSDRGVYAVGTNVAGIPRKRALLFQERTVQQNYVVDNLDGDFGAVAAGSYRWRRWQLDSLATGGRRGGADSSAHYRTSGRSLGTSVGRSVIAEVKYAL